MNNPLIGPVLVILEQAPQGITEYELLKELDKTSQIFANLQGDTTLLLFRKHFLIMNALYQLQSKLWQEDKVKLYISPLKIKIEQQTDYVVSPTTEVEEAPEAKLAAYYLDWDEYDKTKTEDVEALLNGFYHKLDHTDSTKTALAVLDLPSNTCRTEIKKAYRQSIKHAHPDKGGNAQHFIKLRRAYEHLLAYY